MILAWGQFLSIITKCRYPSNSILLCISVSYSLHVKKTKWGVFCGTPCNISVIKYYIYLLICRPTQLRTKVTQIMSVYKCMLCCLMFLVIFLPISTISFSHPNVRRFRGEVVLPAVSVVLDWRLQPSTQGRILDWRRSLTSQVKIYDQYSNNTFLLN